MHQAVCIQDYSTHLSLKEYGHQSFLIHQVSLDLIFQNPIIHSNGHLTSEKNTLSAPLSLPSIFLPNHQKRTSSIDVVEPDEMLVEVCRKHFPELTCGLDDDRVNVYIQDALRFLRNKTGDYDLIINDATDPFGYTEGLFTKEFYGSCYKALKSDGIMVYQHGSPFYSEDKDECVKMHRKAYQAFPVSRVYQAHIPTCSSGYWLFGFASKKYHPLDDFRPEEWKKLGIKTRYYTTNLHRGAFMLPGYVEQMLEEEENEKKT